MEEETASIIDRTFTEIVIVLLFTSFIIVMITQQYIAITQNNIKEQISVAIRKENRGCKLSSDEEVLLNTKKFSSLSEVSGPYFQVEEGNTLSKIPPRVEACITQICTGVINTLYPLKNSINRVYIDGYASPKYGNGNFEFRSLTGRICQTSFECNLVYSSRRALNIYQLCNKSIEIKNDFRKEIWFRETFLAVGKGVPEDTNRERNIEFRVEFDDSIFAILQ